MKYITLSLPMGLRWHGTDYQGRNRWHSANLMRWDDGAMMPVGGWSKFNDVATGDQSRFPDTGAVKCAHSWFANAAAGDSGAAYFLAGATHSNVYIMNGLGEVIDITPTGIAPGSEASYDNRGYGGGLYGEGLYGTQRSAEGQTKVPATTWALDNYGEWLLGVNTTDRNIYKWAPGDKDMTKLANAPVCLSMVTTEERFVFALAALDSSGVVNVRRVAWCDRENPEEWTATALNEAGGFELQTDGAIRCGVRVRGRTLIITTTDAHIAQYSGPPLVYGFQQVGRNCGVISDRAVATTGDGAFWMGTNDFYVYDGSTVRELPCEVHDYVYRFINRSYVSNTYAVANARNNEIWWFYTSTFSPSYTTDGGGLIAYNDRYVSYDYKQNIWSFGEISRMSGVDSGVFNDPVWIDEDNYVWRHELYAQPHVGSTPWAETGPISIGDGDQVIKATQVLTDSIPNKRINLEFKTRFEPQGEERTYGPYEVKPQTDVRFSGRQIRMRVNAIENLEPTENHDYRIGDMRLLITGGGRR
jgi:hypothetical protein